MRQSHGAAKTVSVKLDPDIRTRIGNIAESRQRSPHWVMREAIAQYVEREEKREAFRKEAMKAWEEYQETGLHATAEEVEEWLASWETETEKQAPVCHK
jgi:predicted transcriptional regulator